MHEALILVIKGMLGGTLVLGFSLISQGVSPKRFAGLFGAAPAVAIAGLAVLAIDKGGHAAQEAATGMIAGAVGMSAYAAVSVLTLRSQAGLRASLLALPVWLALAGFGVLVLVLT